MTDPLKPCAFWSRVDKTGSCWLWTGAIQSRGYGHLAVNKRAVLAHRYAWELENGPIADGLVIDHRCRVRACVNPDHMDLVSPKENTMRGIGPTAINARKTACPAGHPYNRLHRGHRSCRKCEQIKAAKERA
jgi:hypothetical protein